MEHPRNEIILLNKFYEQLASKNPCFQLGPYMHKFRSLKTNLERMNFVYADLQKYNLFPKYIESTKNDTVAIVYRQNGNHKFGVGSFKHAKGCYTMSIAWAATSEQLALAYANRSACFFKLGRYQDCEKDIKRALDHNYPENLRPKLVDRLKRAKSEMAYSRLIPYHEEVPEIPASQQHPQIASAKNCVEIKSNDQYGRHIVATRDIKIGEVIAVERPFASFLMSDIMLHCDFCSELCYSPIPCQTCTVLFFCGEDCRAQALEEYHQVECKILSSVSSLEMTAIEGAAVRAIIKSKMRNISLENLSLEDAYKSDRYNEIHNLYSGDGQFPLLKTLIITILSSYLIYFFKEYTSFFDGVDDDKTKEIIFRQLQIARLNTIMIKQIGKPTHLISVLQTFACGLYSFASLFNHSCVPNVEKIFYGNRIVLRAINTIKSGKQCFISYGVTYNEHDKFQRQFVLDQYLFTCTCEACKHLWDFAIHFEHRKKMFFDETHINAFQMVDMEIRMTTDLNILRNYLPKLENRLRKLEHLEPWNNAGELKNMLAVYYRCFGNKKVD